MSARNKRDKSSLSRRRSSKDIGAYWDEHSLADHWDETRETDFEVCVRPPHCVMIDSDIYSQIEARAKLHGMMPDALVNLWLKECLQK